MKEMKYFFIVFLMMGVFTGCSSVRSEQGVENLWRDKSLPGFKISNTTQKEVLEQLGPPSQIISLENQTVFYYLKEESWKRSVILVLYNYSKQTINYDRAIFFFDPSGVLTDYSFSQEKVVPGNGSRRFLQSGKSNSRK